MNITHTKDGRKLYKDELGHWATAPEKDSMRTYSSTVDLKASPDDVNEFPTEREMREYHKEQIEKEDRIAVNAKAAKKARSAELVDDIFEHRHHLSERSEDDVKKDLYEAKELADAYESGLLEENPYTSNGSLSYWRNRVNQLEKELGEVHKRKGFAQKRSWKK